MKLIPSKLTRKQILANALSNQQQLPLVNGQASVNSNSVARTKPKTSGQQFQGFNGQAQQQANMPHS